MKVRFILGREDRSIILPNPQTGTYGFALTFWRRPLAAWWQVGIRFSVLLSGLQPMIRFSTYACPRCDMGTPIYSVVPSKCVARPN
jgi:hypothetical protein